MAWIFYWRREGTCTKEDGLRLPNLVALVQYSSNNMEEHLRTLSSGVPFNMRSKGCSIASTRNLGVPSLSSSSILTRDAWLFLGGRYWGTWDWPYRDLPGQTRQAYHILYPFVSCQLAATSNKQRPRTHSASEKWSHTLLNLQVADLPPWGFHGSLALCTVQ